MPIVICPDNREGSESENVTVVIAITEDVRTLARLMRAASKGEGDLGMLMVGNVSLNRIRAD